VEEKSPIILDKEKEHLEEPIIIEKEKGKPDFIESETESKKKEESLQNSKLKDQIVKKINILFTKEITF